MGFPSGKHGSVMIGTVSYAFGKWKFRMNTPAIKRNNFTSQFQRVVSGVNAGTLNIDGPYDQGNMPFTCGQQYTFLLGLTSGVALTCTAQISDLAPDNDVETAPNVSIVAESDGVFTLAIT